MSRNACFSAFRTRVSINGYHLIIRNGWCWEYRSWIEGKHDERIEENELFPNFFFIPKHLVVGSLTYMRKRWGLHIVSAKLLLISYFCPRFLHFGKSVLHIPYFSSVEGRNKFFMNCFSVYSRIMPLNLYNSNMDYLGDTTK
jgi:hypothetical protein